MLKSKLKLILLVALLVVICSTPFVQAVDTENTSDEAIETTTEVTEATDSTDATAITTTSEDQAENTDKGNYKNSDVYLNGNDINVDYTVVGNAFIAGKNITISAPIGGDAFIIGETVTINTNGYIYSNLFVSCNKLTINGIVYDLYAAAKDITIGENGYVYRDIRTASSNIDIFGTIGRNAYVGCNKIALSSKEGTTGYSTEEDSTDLNGIVYGNLKYSSDNEINVPENSVKGEVKHSTIKTDIKATNISNIIIAALSSIVFTAIIWLLLNWLSPKYVSEAKELLTTKIGTVIGFGLLGLILLPIISIILLIIPVTTKFAAVLIGLYILSIAISTSIFTLAISEFISNKLNLENKWLHLVIASAGALVIYLLKLIPYAGALVSIICIVLGLGILTKKVLPNKKVEE